MHIQPLVKTIQQAFSGEAAKRNVAEIARHHRLQASPGYRAAAEWLAETLREAGLETTIERFPANEQTRFWTLQSFQEWDCRAATLDWLNENGNERLCDYRATALSIVQRSESVDGEFEVVDVGDGRPDDYGDVKVAGKLVLSRSLVRETYQRAVVERGAAGILFDNITGSAPGRSRTDLPDARQYSSSWWQPGDAKSWGFVLTPRQGDAIRAALAAGEQVKVRAHIDSVLYDGEFEVVVATIPGSDQGEVLGMAHLCHPQGFANDNASGVACLLETALTLHHLIASGQLSQPRRTIRFLWMPEMTGTYAWLAAHEDLIPGIVAGINLDMVGENQELTGSVLVLERPPESIASFAPDLLERLRDELLAEQSSLGGTSQFPLFRYTTTPFSGGSDHVVTSDPAVGIPTPMLIQWPDRFYHTTADTMDMVDPKSLERAGTLAGSYLYWLAQAEDEQASWLGWEMISRYERGLGEYAQSETTSALGLEPEARVKSWSSLYNQIGYAQDRALCALETLERLGDVRPLLAGWRAEVEDTGDRVLDRSRRQIRPTALPEVAPQTNAWFERASKIIPVRRYRGPIMDMAAPLAAFPLDESDLAAWRQLYADIPNWRMLRLFAEYWTDGSRTLAEIARLVEMETGQALGPSIETYFHLLAKAGVMELRSNGS